MTNELDDMALTAFLEDQCRLFPEPVCDSLESAEVFLEDCLAVVCDDRDEVIEYLSENADTEGMTDDEIIDSPEVFPLEDGRFLVVEG
jgi:hypothetical protein